MMPAESPLVNGGQAPTGEYENGEAPAAASKGSFHSRTLSFSDMARCERVLPNASTAAPIATVCMLIVLLLPAVRLPIQTGWGCPSAHPA